MSDTYQFEVMIKQAQNGHFVAAIPILPGCISTGQSVEEARDRVMAAAKCYCWNMLENGASVPQIVSQSPAILNQISVKL